MIKKIRLFTPFVVLVVMKLLTIEKFHKFLGLNVLESKYLGIIKTLILFPIMFIIYGVYCATCGIDALLPAISTLILYIVIVVTSYMKYILFSLCMISIYSFFISYFMMRIYVKQKNFNV